MAGRQKCLQFLDAPASLSSTMEIKSLVFLRVCLLLPDIASDWLNIAISYGHKFVFVFDNVLWHNTSSKTKTKTSQEYTASASCSTNFLTCFMEELNMYLYHLCTGIYIFKWPINAVGDI